MLLMLGFHIFSKTVSIPPTPLVPLPRGEREGLAPSQIPLDGEKKENIPFPLMGKGWGEGFSGENRHSINAASFQTRHLDTTVNILEANDVILTQVLAALNFNHHQIDDTGIFKAMLMACRNVRRFIGRNKQI